MKKHTVTYTITETFECEETAKRKVEHYKKFPNIYQELKSSFDKDSFLEFLDNNPATPTEETKELTKREKELIWLADFEAEQRYNDQNNSFHL